MQDARKRVNWTMRKYLLYRAKGAKQLSDFFESRIHLYFCAI